MAYSEALLPHLHARADSNYENSQPRQPASGWDLNPGPDEYWTLDVGSASLPTQERRPSCNSRMPACEAPEKRDHSLPKRKPQPRYGWRSGSPSVRPGVEPRLTWLQSRPICRCRESSLARGRVFPLSGHGQLCMFTMLTLIYIVFENSVLTSQKAHTVSISKANRLMLFREMFVVYCENHKRHINITCIKTQCFNVTGNGTYSCHCAKG
jgi:hypothetical protein